ncbi:uncharacterized protein M421DRAFT_357700 [Didymella exigua CBS 183.55]|uniref:Uncharacterized protein n=1 Tax=Didymella exigua CBS 183.55 TaxID=1150837 RepID=A0A6A5RQM5_9PLEO|nr:uncharacterized protein M421DRAFT_357700 [Didymella exigua CBS 183.55]KAF1930741.1 hypothetical protein M421DRAFT_357700 [Didymella exigua CBS 183.55]
MSFGVWVLGFGDWVRDSVMTREGEDPDGGRVCRFADGAGPNVCAGHAVLEKMLDAHTAPIRLRLRGVCFALWCCRFHLHFCPPARTSHVSRNTHSIATRELMYVCMHVCMYVVCMHVCMYVVCMHLCMYVVCMHVCMYVCMHVCMHVYISSLGISQVQLRSHNGQRAAACMHVHADQLCDQRRAWVTCLCPFGRRVPDFTFDRL